LSWHARRDDRRARAREALSLALFAATLFANAALLFSVEPMFTKMVLPLLGGTPAVWNTCLLFFQTALLAGYLYAHLAARWLTHPRQVALHLTLLAVSVAALPVGIAPGWQPPATASPISWLLALLAVSLGAPFFLLSTGAPLLQRWFSYTDIPSARDPYFLYAASNLGSVVALLAYPVLVEPKLPLAVQSRAWSAGYGGLLALIAACAAVSVARSRSRAQPQSSVTYPLPATLRASPVEKIPLGRVVRWILLALVPSSLLLGLTSYLSTDVAAVPLLWIVPLAVYLLTFILVFARRRPVPHWLMVWAQSMLLVPLTLMLVLGAQQPIWLIASFHLLAFFTTAMVCHGELAASRPPSAQLTQFYLWISVGGVLGGVFNALLAPVLFNNVVEYPLVLVVACALRPAPERATASDRRQLWLDLALPLSLGLFIWFVIRPNAVPLFLGRYTVWILCGVAGVLCFAFRDHPLRFALGLASLLVGGALGTRGTSRDVLLRDRSFFGAYRVRTSGDVNLLMNGTTLHGAQSRWPEYRREPLTYYHRDGPLGQLFASLLRDRANRHVAVIGLGTGTAACYGREGERWTFYEIDPLVERIARDPRYFTYLRDCPPTSTVVLGDARLSLAAAPDHSYDLILLDAFSSDAIPTHLLTREALALYLSKLTDGGAVVFHISNRYLDLRPVVTELARDARVAGVIGTDVKLTEQQRVMSKVRSVWVALSPRATDLATLARQPGWQLLPPRADVRVWTDDYSDIFGVFRWR
jgi:hypothetical protein